MSALANHMRISGLQITNEDVDSRKAAITSIKTVWNKITTLDSIFVKAADVAAALGGDGTPSEALGKEVEAAVQKKASAFLHKERPLEVGIVAGLVATEIMGTIPNTSGWLIADIWAAALWSALGFQPPLPDEKREALRMSVLQVARDRCIAGAEKARERVMVPNLGAVSLSAGEEGKLGNALKEAAAPTIDALRRNSALDREELDFLWWAQLRRSRLLRQPLDSIDEVARVVACGVEGAAYLRRMPCDVHREIVLRTLDANPSVALVGVLTALGPDRETLAALYPNGLPAGGAILFPLLAAIITGESDGLPAATIERTAEEWGSRALLEAALLKMRASGPSTL
ncbi:MULTISPECIES: GTPase-associated system all-helical protein GASH [unclassified Mesorhizobium]|uniref:GTPase-associated system all-helical protein GASH n=1 Tax=unclassified Mesorhizobium TaxID=325217 RepID=UPI0003CFBF9E|nr:GTPase-associated system all-helical protein GASH [Mesorhizobium sp. L2C067A000]ESZ35914.1 membrane protein [Mesorhizobium sp. L2C067A000]